MNECKPLLPGLQEPVRVVGYPIGGVAISVTSGVVSRIEVTSYSHGCSELLGLQIDAAINSGNSGGPAFNTLDECVGVAFQSLKHEDAENIGYVIPTPVIDHFITDYDRNGQYTGFPTLGLEWQKLGRAVQVDPIKPTLKAPGTKRLKLEYDELLSSFAFSFNLRRFSWRTPTCGYTSICPRSTRRGQIISVVASCNCRLW